MDSYFLAVTIIGLAALIMAWMPAITEKTRISFSVWYVLAGFILYEVFDFFPNPDPLIKEEFALHFSELVVIVSLMGSGLKIDETFSFKTWGVPFRLVSITMILTISLVALLTWYIFDIDAASAILLGAVLAPTDPVLASDVQVGPPLQRERNNIRFSLTAEAGMNDGTAFPFVWLAITVFYMTTNANFSLESWFWKDVIYKIIFGVLIGITIARSLAWLLFRLPEKNGLTEVRDGFVAVSATLTIYGITELLRGYGFIAVFVAAITLRNYEMEHNYHKRLHSFTDQIERIMLAIILLLFGGSVASGILDSLTPALILFCLSFLLVIRPATAFLALIDTKLHLKEKLAISFFGIKGIGSFFYLAFALKAANFNSADQLWSIVAFVVLISIVIHGCSAKASMRKLDEKFSDEIRPE